MVRYSRRYRSSRAKRSTLSTRRIFSRTGARAQANQIYALRKRVNYVYKKTKPERKVAVSGPASFSFNSGITGGVYNTYTPLAIAKGTANDQRVGDKIYCKDKYLFSLEYYNTSSTGFHDSESSGVQVRVIVGRYKTPVDNAIGVNPSNLIQSYSNTGDGYSTSAVAPLLTNVTQSYIIDTDRTFYLTADKNQRIVKVSTKTYTRRYDDANSSNSNHSFVLILVAGLHYDNDFKEYVKGTRIVKTVFTDA